MRGLFASRRFRRRAGWWGVALAVAGLVAFLGIHFSNTGQKLDDGFTPGKPQRVAPNPKTNPFTPAEARQVRAVAVAFIRSAVYRKDVGHSFDLTTSDLRQGASRSQWASGTIPVVPFPQKAVDTVRWRLDYSYPTEVGLQVAFYTKPRSGVDRQMFDISLQNHGSAAKPRWLVSYWAPQGGLQISRADPRAPEVDTAPPKPALGAVWLFVPIGLIVGGLVGVVVFLVVRGRVRHTRAVRAAKLYRSSSSPS